MSNQSNTGFKELLTSLMQKRWYVTATVLGLFIIITLGIFSAIVLQVPMAAAWKELLMLLLGAFIGSSCRHLRWVPEHATRTSGGACRGATKGRD